MNTQNITPWVVVLTFAQAEWQSYRNLTRRGVRSFLPYTLGTARRGRWDQGVVRPQYPGYVFAQLGPEANTEVIRKVVGVRDLLKVGPRLVYLQTAEIESCRRQWLEDYRASLPALPRRVEIWPGKWLKVPSGPFEGAPCKVETIDKSGRIVAWLGKLQVAFHLTDVSPRAVRASAKPTKNSG